MPKIAATRFCVGVIAFAAGLAVLLACRDNFTDKTAQKKVENTAPALSVTAETLMADYTANEIAADGRYKGKVLRISGTVNGIAKDLLDTMYVTLSAGGPYSILNVQCYFPKGATARLAALKKGAQITVKGRCEGKMGNVLVKNCTFSK